MPLPLIPVAIGLASLLGYGVKKGIDANDNFSKAKSVGERAKERHENAIKQLEEEKEKTNGCFVSLGSLKASIFSTQIKHLVDVIKKSKKASSKIKDFEEEISALNLPEMERMVAAALHIEKGMASGAVGGTLAGLGAYGTAGAVGFASTGTAISSLSGVAATNATLAWLGGGTLASGGLGMAGGTMVLGGIAVAPAVAIAALVVAKKSEQALTKAREYEHDVDTAIAEIEAMKIVLSGLMANAIEVGATLQKLVQAFEAHKVSDMEDENSFNQMLAIGKSLKAVLDQPILEDDGSPVKHLKSKMQTKIGGLLQLS